MSHSQTTPKGYQSTEEGGQTFLPSQAEYYLNSLSEWRNIQDIIRLTFKAIVDVVKVQGQSIKDIEQILPTKANKGEISTALNLKANNAEIMRVFSDMSSSLESRASIDEMNTLLEDKISKSDLLYYLKAKPSTEEVRNMLEDKLDLSEYKMDMNEIKQSIESINKDATKKGQYATIVDISKLNSKIDSKVTMADVMEVQKTGNEAIQLSLQKKANKIDLETKAEKSEFNSLSMQLNKIEEGMKGKIERKLFDKYESSMNSLNNRIETIDQDLDRLIDNIKKQFKSLNDVISCLEVNKANITQVEKLGMSLGNKFDSNVSIEKLKEHFEGVILELRQEHDDHFKNFNEQYSIVSQDVKTAISDLINQKEAFNSYINKTQKDKESSHGQFKLMINGLGKDYSTMKSKVDEIYKEIDKRREDMHKKASKAEVENYINNAIQSKHNEDIELIEKLSSDLEQLKLFCESLMKNNNKNSLSNSSNSGMNINEINNTIESLKNCINQKANIKEILALLKNKAEVDDVNKTLINLHDELDNKICLEQFNEAMDSQAILNDAICAENIFGRWRWKSGKIRNGYMIPFELQTANTAAENFLWEKDKTSIIVVMPGLYEVTLGFYSIKKPTVQLMINDEVVISAVGSGGVLKYGYKGNEQGFITGLTMVEFLLLPENTKVGVSFIGENNSEGFIGIKKL